MRKLFVLVVFVLLFVAGCGNGVTINFVGVGEDCWDSSDTIYKCEEGLICIGKCVTEDEYDLFKDVFLFEKMLSIDEISYDYIVSSLSKDKLAFVETGSDNIITILDKNGDTEVVIADCGNDSITTVLLYQDYLLYTCDRDRDIELFLYNKGITYELTKDFDQNYFRKDPNIYLSRKEIITDNYIFSSYGIQPLINMYSDLQDSKILKELDHNIYIGLKKGEDAYNEYELIDRYAFSSDSEKGYSLSEFFEEIGINPGQRSSQTRYYIEENNIVDDEFIEFPEKCNIEYSKIQRVASSLSSFLNRYCVSFSETCNVNQIEDAHFCGGELLPDRFDIPQILDSSTNHRYKVLYGGLHSYLSKDISLYYSGDEEEVRYETFLDRTDLSNVPYKLKDNPPLVDSQIDEDERYEGITGKDLGYYFLDNKLVYLVENDDKLEVWTNNTVANVTNSEELDQTFSDLISGTIKGNRKLLFSSGFYPRMIFNDVDNKILFSNDGEVNLLNLENDEIEWTKTIENHFLMYNKKDNNYLVFAEDYLYLLSATGDIIKRHEKSFSDVAYAFDGISKVYGVDDKSIMSMDIYTGNSSHIYSFDATDSDKPTGISLDRWGETLFVKTDDLRAYRIDVNNKTAQRYYEETENGRYDVYQYLPHIEEDSYSSFYYFDPNYSSDADAFLQLKTGEESVTLKHWTSFYGPDMNLLYFNKNTAYFPIALEGRTDVNRSGLARIKILFNQEYPITLNNQVWDLKSFSFKYLLMKNHVLIIYDDSFEIIKTDSVTWFL